MEINYNNVTICGRIEPITYSHEVGGEVFYKTMIHSPRLSENEDVIPVIIPEAMRLQIDQSEEYLVHARICSRDDKTGEKCKLRLSLLADSIVPVRGHVNCNNVELEGYVCKGPCFRTTKLGKDICQMVIATNHNHKSYYIPCVSFGSAASEAQEYKVGDKIRLTGRIQSREYLTSDYEIAVTYEVAIKKLTTF